MYKKSFYYFNFFFILFKVWHATCNYHIRLRKNILGDTIREKREKKYQGCKVGTILATTTPSARKAVKPSLD